MSLKKRMRKIKKLRAKEKKRKKKFFDANALRLDKCYREIDAMSGTKFVAITSYFAFGEAVGSQFNEEQGKINVNASKYLFELLCVQIGNGNLRLVSAEGAKDIFDDIRGAYFDDKEITDIHHIAVAISERCVAVVSGDRDIWGISNETIGDIKRKYSLKEFSMEKRPPD